MKKLFSIIIIFSLFFSNVSAYAMGSPQSSNPNGYNYVPPPKPKTSPPATKNGSSKTGKTTTTACANVTKGCGPNACTNTKGCPPSIPAQAKMSLPKMFYIPHAINGLEIQKIPEDILDNSSLEGWLFGLGASLIIFGFIYNMYMNLYRLAVGAESKNSSYWQLFARFIFALVFLYVWSKGIFFNQYLTMVDNMQNYIWTSLAASSGVTGIETVVKNALNTIHGSKGSGFEWYDPFTWDKLAAYAATAILEFIFMIILFIVYLIYAVFYFVIYIFQLLILGVLFSIFPIALGLWMGEYSEGVKPLQSWFKWFVEVSTWGIGIGLMDVIFNTVVENSLANAGLLSTVTGISLLIALSLIVVMIILLLAGPFLIHKIFGMNSGGEHTHGAMGKIKGAKDSKDSKESQKKIQEALKAMATGGASIPADMAKDGLNKGVQEATNSIKEQGGTSAGGIAPGASTKRNDTK